MKYVLTDEKKKEIWDRFTEETGPGGSGLVWKPIAFEKEKNSVVWYGVMADEVYVLENNDFDKCIATGNMDWWESVKQEYFDKGFTDDFWEDDEVEEEVSHRA